MKAFVLSLMLALCLFCGYNASAQVIFMETFGQTTVRQSSPYMPAASYGWGDPNGIPNEKMVENNYYAVIAPSHIRDAWPIPDWWFWTGPEPIGNTWGGAGNPAASDHTGDVDGAVMAVNAGSTLNGFYKRNASLVPGQSYELSMWVYLVNASSMLSMQLLDPVDNSVLGSYTTPFLSTEDNWQQFSYDFTLPASCTNGGLVQVYLANAYSAFGGNDYYVDDIQLTTISPGGAASINCPSRSTLALNKIMLTADKNTNGVSLSWMADDGSDGTSYRLQKSVDGLQFETIYTLSQTPGNIPEKHFYTDMNVAETEKIYYRIAAAKQSGAVVYSSVVTVVSKENSGIITVFPQPVKPQEPVYIKINQASASAVVLYNMSGVKLKAYSCYPGQTLSMGGLSAGQYFLKVIGKTGSPCITKKLLVQ